MHKLRTVIVDDEPLALDLMRSMLQQLSRIDIVAECKNGNEAITAIRKSEPDLVFLDIQMPVMSGFEVAKALQSDTMPCIVFATAYDEYALQAFDIHAVDYLLKPIDIERLELSVTRAAERLALKADNVGRKGRIVSAIEDISKNDQGTGDNADDRYSKLAVRDSGKLHLVDQEDIHWIDAAGDYVCIHVDNEVIIARTTMRDLLESLDSRRFVRIHRSTIINIKRIRKVTPLTKGESQIELGQGVELKVSRSYRDVIKNRLLEIEAGLS